MYEILFTNQLVEITTMRNLKIMPEKFYVIKTDIYIKGSSKKDDDSIQFNLIRVYLHANLTSQRPITKLARVHRNTQKYN
jgi:hypothetical protein